MSAAVVVVAENLGHGYKVVPAVGIRWKLNVDGRGYGKFCDTCIVHYT